MNNILLTLFGAPKKYLRKKKLQILALLRFPPTDGNTGYQKIQ